MPKGDSADHEIKKLMIFIFLKLFRPNEHTEDYHIRKPKDENFLFETRDKETDACGRKSIYF